MNAIPKRRDCMDRSVTLPSRGPSPARGPPRLSGQALFLRGWDFRSLRLEIVAKLNASLTRLCQLSRAFMLRQLLYQPFTLLLQTTRSRGKREIYASVVNLLLLFCWSYWIQWPILLFISFQSMEAGASGVVGQNAARLVDLECGHVNESATHPNLQMMARRATRLKK